MNNFNIPENIELISAYLDGEVTEDERAVIENDPNLLREIETFRSMSTHIGQIYKQDKTTKESHIFAAIREAEKPFEVSAEITNRNIFSFRKVTHISKRRPVRVIALSGIAAAILTFFAIPIFQSDTPKTDPLIVAAEIPTTAEQKESTPVLESAPVTETTSENESFSAPLEESTTNESDVLPEIESDNGENSEAEKEQLSLEASEEVELEVSNSSSDRQQSAFATSTSNLIFGNISTYGNSPGESNSELILNNVGIDQGEMFDKFVIELTSIDSITDTAMPGPYAVELNAVDYVMEESSFVLPSNVSEYLVINLAARGGFWNDENYESWGYFGQVIAEEESPLTGFYLGDFEGNLTFVLGIEEGSRFRSGVASNPPRLIIEVENLISEPVIND